MREIKFRVWDGGRMRNVDLYFFEEEGIRELPCQFADHLRIMQYTGLKDKNGKDIYEGDIVKTSGYQNPISGEIESDLCVVEYHGPHLCYCEHFANEGESGTKRTYVLDLIGGADKDDDAEVIGNVHENQELLTP